MNSITPSTAQKITLDFSVFHEKASFSQFFVSCQMLWFLESNAIHFELVYILFFIIF